MYKPVVRRHGTVSRLLEETQQPESTDGPAVDLRFCTFCQEQFPRDQLAWSAGRWTCVTCRAQSDSVQAIESVARFEELEEEDATDHLVVIHRVDTAFRFAEFFGRYGLYALGCYLATKYEPINDMLHGVVMADFGTWLLKSFFDFKTHRWPILIELLGFVILTSVMLHTDAMEIPSDPASIGLAFLAFTLFFTVKGTFAMVSRIHGHT